MNYLVTNLAIVSFEPNWHSENFWILNFGLIFFIATVETKGCRNLNLFCMTKKYVSSLGPVFSWFTELQLSVISLPQVALKFCFQAACFSTTREDSVSSSLRWSMPTTTFSLWTSDSRVPKMMPVSGKRAAWKKLLTLGHFIFLLPSLESATTSWGMIYFH